MRWFVGDVHGCATEFEQLLETIRFDPGRDELWSVGDLIHRGPDSLGALRLWQATGGRGVLGNHDIHGLRVFAGSDPKPRPSLTALMAAADGPDLLAALRALPVLIHLPAAGTGPEVWLVHAGLHPGWVDLPAVARSINDGERDEAWLIGDAVQFAVSVRCTTAAGERCSFTGPPEHCPSPATPWDDFYRGADLVVHGHWAARGHYRGRRTLGLDSGCVYGGALTAWCQDEDRVVQVPARGRR